MKKIIVNDVEVKVTQHKVVRSLLDRFETVISEIFRDRERCFPACSDEKLIELLELYTKDIGLLMEYQIGNVKDYLSLKNQNKTAIL